jgi:gamma-glutamyltranspeptidase/glutathione hydrolase
MPRLAETLEAIADEGPDVFYSGRIGRAIADHVRKLGGLLTADDMAAYRARTVEPVSVEVRGQTLFTPPPSSGGLTSLQIVALFDRLERLGKAGPAGDPRAFEGFLETAKVAWEERLTRLADPPSMTVAPRDLLAAGHLDELLRRVLEGLAHPGPGKLVAPDPIRGTVHLAAADAAGNLVSWTQTHGGGFGSMVMVPGTGVVLGHGMSRFEPRPGWVNSIAPGKRPLHNMSPAVAVAGGRAVLAVGASGGRTIVNNSAALLINRLILALEPGDAVAAPRLQCETLEPAVIESAAGAACIAALRARGHALTEVPRDAGNAFVIARDGEAWVGVPEPRLAGSAAVWAGRD